MYRAAGSLLGRDRRQQYPPNTLKSAVTLTAIQPGSGTRSAGSTRIGFSTSDGAGYWQKDDIIGVWSYDDGKFMPFTLVSGAGTAKATFKGEITGTLKGVTTAAYPYSDKLALNIAEDENSGEIQAYFTSAYTYDGVDTVYSVTDGKSFNMLMLGNVSTNSDGSKSTVEFRHYGSLLALKVDSLPSSEGAVTVSADGNICGTVEYYENSDGSGTRYASDAGNEVTFTYSNATKGKPGVFYVPLLAGDYVVTVKVKGKNSEEKFAESFEKFSVEKAHIKPLVTSLSDYRDYSTTIDGKNVIDLGISVLWAECNVGAELPADVGNYYSWGETSTKESYTRATAKYQYYNSTYDVYPFSKYTDSDGKRTLEAGDDAVTVNWGTSWRMPTYDEIQKLIENCTYEEASLTNSDGNEVTCYKLTSKKNGNCIYIPCSGYKDDSNTNDSSKPMFWSSCHWYNSSKGTWSAMHGSVYKSHSLTYDNRYRGFPVRPVRNKTVR